METILTVKEESMIAVADAVREKSGTSGALSFPNGMVDAINSIETSIAAVEVDNKTIIKDENGVISTAIGGYYADPVPAEMLYENNNNITLTYAHHENLNCSFDGYFPLPNWSPIGEEHYGKTFRLTWYETPYPDSPDYVIECFADAWFLDENLQTIMVENRENTEMVAGSIDNNTGYLSCMPHIYENPDDWEGSYVSNFRIEIAGSDGGAVPFSAEFIPQDIFDGISNAYNRADEAYSRADEAHGRIDYLEQNGGGGSSLAVDGLTIIEQDGVIKTAIGGGVNTYNTSDNLYYLWNWNLTFTLNEDETAAYYQLPSWTPLGEEWIDRELHFIAQEYNPDTDEYTDYDTMGYFDGTNIYMGFGLNAGSDFIDNATGRIECDPTSTWQITRFVFEVYVENISYIPIDANFIPVDYDTIQIADGRLVAAGGVSEDRVNELINEALGVIENGSY
jgi:hypothetical protein